MGGLRLRRDPLR